MMEDYVFGFYRRASVAIDVKRKDEAIAKADVQKRLE
jgi:hypothetical protein